MNLAALRNRVDSLAGLDLESDERDDLINEAYTELCVESEWLRADVELGPAVADQDAYTFPADVYRILRLTVGGARAYPTDTGTVGDLRRGDIVSAYNAFFYWQDADGSISFYPTPTAGAELTATAVVAPDPLTDPTDEPALPPSFHHYIPYYIAAENHTLAEDDPERAQWYADKFEEGKLKLRRLRLSRMGRGSAYLRVGA